MSALKTFDGEKAVYGGVRLEWLQKHKDRPTTLDEFMAMWEATRLHYSGNARSPSQGRREYRILKERFGFFV